MKGPQALAYDLVVLREFFDGDEEAVADIVRIMVEEIPLFLDKISKEAKEGCWDEVGRTAHKFKPVTVNLGVASIKEAIAQIENCAASGNNPPNIEGFLNQLRDELGPLRERLAIDFKV